MTPGLQVPIAVLTGIQGSSLYHNTLSLPFLYAGANVGCIGIACECPAHTELVVPGFHLTNKKAKPSFISAPVNEEKTLDPITLTALAN